MSKPDLIKNLESELLSTSKMKDKDKLQTKDSVEGFIYVQGLRLELEERNPNHKFTTGKPVNKNIGLGYTCVEYDVMMDDTTIGKITKVHGKDFDNTVYEGRLPGYVNKLMESINKFDNNELKIPVDQISLQYTIGTPYSAKGFFASSPRKDGHPLKFI